MTGPFNEDRLRKGRRVSNSATEIERALYTEGHILEIEHVPTKYKVNFPAYLQNFSDAFTGEQHSAFSMYESKGIEFDHKRPMSDGHDGEDNLRPISKKANRERSNKKLLKDN